MNKKSLVTGSIILAIIFIIISFVYWFTPAGSLPSFFPGFIAGSTVIHIKHGAGMFILGLVLIAYAWFSTGKKLPNQ
jgi:hypothetical protein